ncbi:MAG: hypothetical protein AB7K41_16575, partial [Bdellovibrionales bacterium]
MTLRLINSFIALTLTLSSQAKAVTLKELSDCDRVLTFFGEPNKLLAERLLGVSEKAADQAQRLMVADDKRLIEIPPELESAMAEFQKY